MLQSFPGHRRVRPFDLLHFGARCSRMVAAPASFSHGNHLGSQVARPNYAKRAGWADASSGSRKLLRATPTRRKRCAGFRPTRSRSDSAMLVNSSQDEGGEAGVWLRVRILNSLVFNLSTTVRAIRDSLRDAAQVCSASLRIIGSNSVK